MSESSARFACLRGPRLSYPKIVILLTIAVPLCASPGTAEPPLSPSVLLDRAFSNLYEIDHVRIARVRVTSQHGDELDYTVELASKLIGGRLHSYGLFLDPPRLRDMAMLTIEAPDRTDDHFLYMPASRRTRRVSSAQRMDTFMGTDLAYEDFERRRATDYAITSTKMVDLDQEPVYRIAVTPIFESSVARVEFDVASRDFVLLAVRSFREGATAPFRTLRAPREDVRNVGSHSLPATIIVDNTIRRTRTVVEFEQLRAVEDLEDPLFSARSLDIRRRVPGLQGLEDEGR